MDFKKILYSEEDSLVKHINKNILPFLPFSHNTNLSICDIGAGDGLRTSQIMKYLSSNYNLMFHLDFIEQSPIFCSYFQSMLADMESFSNTTVYNDLFENCFDNNKKYDMIFLIHSIFTLDQTCLVESLLKSLNKDGYILIVSNSSNSILANLKNEIDIDYSDRRFEIAELKTNLKSQNISHQCHRFITEWHIPEYRIDNDIDEILEWLSLGEYKSMDTFKQLELKQLFLEYSDRQSNSFYFQEDEEIVTIHNI